MKLLFLPIDINIDKINLYQGNNFIKSAYWNSTKVEEFSGLDQIIKQLPFSKLTVCTHKKQKAEVGVHVDVFTGMHFEKQEFEHIKNNEPCGFRLLLAGSSNGLEVHNGQKWVTAQVPESPSCYVINSTECKHRVKFEPNRETVYFRGYIDKEKYTELINRSILKYKSQAIYQI